MTTAEESSDPQLPRLRPASKSENNEPPFEPKSWGGALAYMAFVAGVLWAVEIANAVDDYGLNRFGLRPREVGGLWGILTTPFLHNSAWQLLSSTGPFVLIGWVVLLSGMRSWLVVTGLVLVIGGVATWLIAPGGLVLGCSGLIFGWMGYLLARAYFTRRIAWILAAVLVAFFFSGLFAGLLPSINSKSSWQAHVCSFGAGIVAGWLLHPRGTRAERAEKRAASA
ncbi:MAG TPA: rhomboid family intramembrane serine protease [Jatrophihabitantaceae bacterium]